jgi:hypothetical protein
MGPLRRRLAKILGAATLFLSACAPAWRLPEGSEPDPKQEIASGALLETYVTQQSKLLHPELQTACDSQDREAVIELLTALDQRAAIIARFEKSKPSTGPAPRKLRLSEGDFILRDDRASKRRLSLHAQEEELPSWSELIRTRQNAERLGNSPEAQALWSQMSSLANSLLRYDQMRLQWGYNFSTRLLERPLVSRLLQKMDECLSDARCDPRPLLLVSTSIEERQILRRHKPYAEMLALASKRQEVLESRRTQLGALRDWVKRDFDRAGFTRNSHVTRSSAHVFTVEMDAGSFKNHRSTVADWLRSFWSSDRWNIEIHWRDSVPEASVFRFELIDVGGLAHVFYPSKALRLPWVSSWRTLAHEFGHVLGLPDRYETLWDSERCRYTQRSWPDDLMSASGSGQVLEEHWQELDREYPWRP